MNYYIQKEIPEEILNEEVDIYFLLNDEKDLYFGTVLADDMILMPTTEDLATSFFNNEVSLKEAIDTQKDYIKLIDSIDKSTKSINFLNVKSIVIEKNTIENKEEILNLYQSFIEDFY